MTNPWTALKAYFAIEKAVNKEKEAYAMSEHNWMSTEFWVTAVPTLVTLWGSLKGFVPQPYAAYVEIAGVGIYTLSRTAKKIVADIQAAKK